MRKIIMLLLVLSSLGGRIFADTPVKVSGRVISSNGLPLAFANVTVKEKTIGVATDRDGNFSLSLPDDKMYTLVASYTGYEAMEVKISGLAHSNVEFRLPEDLLNINTVVVTGTRTPKLLKDSPVLTRVISAEDIRKVDPTHIGDLLEAELPGVEFSFSMNQQVSLNMQGFGGTSVLFLVDGERVAGETMDNVDYSRLTMSHVNRIEVVKGAASSLYGSNAVGGVVNIITVGATRPWEVELNARHGSHNAQRYGGSVGFIKGRFNSVTDFQRDSRDHYSFDVPKEGSDYTGMYGYHTYLVKERLGITLSDRVELVAKGSYSFRERDYSEIFKNRYRGFNGGLRMNYDIAPGQTLEAAYNFDQYDKSNYYPEKSKDIRNYSNIQNTARVLYNYTFDGGHILTLGADGMTDYLMSYQFEDNRDYRMYSADAFAQFDWRLSPRWNLVGGARLDYFSEVKDPRFSPKLALMFKVNDLALRGSYSAGFRAPTLKEMHMVFDMGSIFTIYGNPDLKSETSHNLMLSAEYMKRRWNLTVSGYYNSINDRISTVWSTELNGMKYLNTRRANIAGADANLSVKFPWGFGGRISYAYAHDFVKNGEVSTFDARPHTGLLRLEYGKTFRDYSFNVMLSGRFMSELNTHTLDASDSFQSYVKVHYPGYSMWKLSVSQKIWRPFNLLFTVDNLLNYKPSIFSYNSPTAFGTMYSVGISMNIEELFKKR